MIYTRKRLVGDQIIKKAMLIVGSAQSTVCMTMGGKEEIETPTKKKFFRLVNQKLRDGIKVTRIGFGSAKSFEQLRRKVHLKHSKYTFRRRGLSRYRRMLLVDDSKLMFRKAGRVFYSEGLGDIAKYRQYFERYLPTE